MTTKRESFRILGLIGDIIGIIWLVTSVWGFLRAWIWGDGDITLEWYLAPGFAMQLYGGLIAGAVALFVILHWSWLQSFRPSVRFRSIAGLLEMTMLDLEEDHAGTPHVRTETSSETKSLLHQTIHELDDLKVPHPPFAYDVNRWLVFLSRVLGDARVGKLTTARTRWSVIEAEDV